MGYVSVNRLFVIAIGLLLAIVLLVAALWSASVQREAERDACDEYSAYLDC